MPVEGGFYRWTRAAFGDFWGFLAGWWNWTASFVLGSVYAVLFSDYLSFYFPQIAGWRHYLVSVGADRGDCRGQRARHRGGRETRDRARNRGARARGRALRRLGPQVARQPVCADDP